MSKGSIAMPVTNWNKALENISSFQDIIAMLKNLFGTVESKADSSVIDIIQNTVDSIKQGYKLFNTLAELTAYTGTDKSEFQALVNFDTTATNNGVYLWKDNIWQKSLFDAFVRAQGFANANPLFKPVTVTIGQFTSITQMTMPGHYIIDNNTIAAAITGLPEAKAGFIDVIADGAFVRQEYSPSSSNYKYIRTGNVAGVFPAFEKLVGQSYIDFSVTTAKQQLQDVLIIDGSKNLFNAATVRIGYRLSGSGAVNPVSGAKCSDYIAINGGEKFTISAASKPVGVAFFADKTSNTPLLYSASTANPLTITAPENAAYMVVNVKYEADNNDAVNLQVELGSSASSYVPYSAKPILKKNIMPDNVVTTATAALASAKPYDIITQSKNVFSESNIVQNSYLTNGGAISSSSNWTRTGMIAVVPGQVYTLSGNRGRYGVSGFANSTDTSAAFYVADSTMPLTFTIPIGVNFLSFNLQSATAQGWSNIQLELGSSATIYIPMGASKFQIDGTAILNAGTAPDTSRGVFTGGMSSQTIKGMQGADTILHTVAMTTAASHDASRVFNWTQVALNGLVLHTCGDDAAPYRINDTTLGANHGYSKTRLTMTAHGKTLADVGSVWTDGSQQWVICGIYSVNQLEVTNRTLNTSSSGSSGTLTHVSGATNTSTINWTAKTALQWYPMLKNHKISVTADGKNIDPTSTTPVQFDKLVVSQSYELMTKPAIVEWLIAHAGSSADFTEYSAASNVSVSMNYTFDKYGNCTINTDFLALDTVALTTSDSAAIMFIQTARLTPALDGNVYYYMPKALSLVHEGVTYDFANKADVSTFAPTTRLQMTPSRCVATGQLLDRVVQLTNNWGYATGYLPILSADPTVRRTLAAKKALELNNNEAKIYFSAIDSASITTLNPGDFFSVTAYRNYFRRPAGRTNSYTVSSKQGDFLFLDWHIATLDQVALPTELIGRALSVVEKSDTVTVLSQAATSRVAVKTTGAGYAVLKFS